MNDILEFELPHLGKLSAVPFSGVKATYNTMYLVEERNLFVKLTKIDFDTSLCKKLLRELVYYHKFLTDIGVKVPKNHFIGIHNGTHILEVDDYIPLTFSLAVKQMGIEKAVTILFRDVFKPLFATNTTKYLECGIDTPLRNFQFKNDKAYYIDFFLPRIFFGVEDTTLELPDLTDPKDRMTGFFNKFIPDGVLYSIFINLCREFPKKREFFKQSCIDLANEINQPELARHVRDSVPEAIFNKGTPHVIEFINNMNFENEEYLIARDLACYIASIDEEFEFVLEDFFSHTSNAGGKTFYVDHRINAAKDFLIKHVKS